MYGYIKVHCYKTLRITQRLINCSYNVKDGDVKAIVVLFYPKIVNSN